MEKYFTEIIRKLEKINKYDKNIKLNLTNNQF